MTQPADPEQTDLTFRNRSMRAQTSRIHRRTVLRGAGVAMALPWLESLPVWGGEAATGGGAAGVSQALRRAVHGQRDQPEPLVGEGGRRGHGAEQEPPAPGAAARPS